MIKKTSKKRALTRDYLVRATYSYLQRFATTEKNLRDVLERKVRRRLFEGAAEPETRPNSGDNLDRCYDPDSETHSLAHFEKAQGWIEEIVQKAVEQNFVNDRTFADSRAKSLIRRGNSKMQIIQKLHVKGVPSDMVSEVMQDLSEQIEDQDFLAAIKYIKKRRFGAFNTRRKQGDCGPEEGAEGETDHREPYYGETGHGGPGMIVEKELATLCRAGFSYIIGRKILAMSPDALEDILYHNSILR